MRNSDRVGVTEDVAAIRDGISTLFKLKTDEGVALHGYFGVYVFFDYDGEPIYVGQTHEGLGSRVGRHMTNQRTDAVAMNVLDPFEVAFIEVFPIFHKRSDRLPPQVELKKQLDALEYSVFQKFLRNHNLAQSSMSRNLLRLTWSTYPNLISTKLFLTTSSRNDAIQIFASHDAPAQSLGSLRSLARGTSQLD